MFSNNDRSSMIGAETAQGNCYNLDELFAAIDREYFAGNMLKPRLIWRIDDYFNHC
jgi:hypothetical protein